MAFLFGLPRLLGLLLTAQLGFGLAAAGQSVGTTKPKPRTTTTPPKKKVPAQPVVVKTPVKVLVKAPVKPVPPPPPPPPPVPPKEEPRGSVRAELSYGTNSSFFGRTQTTRFPYTAAELSYTSRYGIWGSVVSFNLFDTPSFIDETDLSVGWDGDLTKTVDASLSYSHFLFARNSPLVKSSTNNSIDAYVGWDWGYVYSRLNAAYLFGESNDFFLVLDNSRYFEIDKVFTPKAYVAIEPRLSVAAGTQHFVETSIEQQIVRGNNPGNGKGKGKGNGNGNGGTGSGGGSGSGGTTTITTTTENPVTRFRVLTYELRVPVTYHLGAVAVQAAWRYSIPVNLLPDDVTHARSYFTTSVSYTL
ncbi:hypothetical protein [Hymenobacter cellulosilyticus]|uniref:DUF481 domain-containing protein n=1 Tax=Hymenobacter cellulosilyticus TaxID=2932248 RepID=A0A8T9QBB1_9BACT|nr:hypothetical protein [Hymenobacter cellulosilyticus]UOQ74854.1 hypothetical protein MUN79_13865 [Hymenobacter cellulosilyticus]